MTTARPEPSIDPADGRDPATLPADGMLSGSGAGSARERAPVDPDDRAATAVEEDAPPPAVDDAADGAPAGQPVPEHAEPPD